MVDATDNVCWLFLSQVTFNTNVTPDPNTATASNATQLITDHASDCNWEIKRADPITVALRLTANTTAGTVLQSVILGLYVYLSRVECKIDIVPVCKLLLVTDARFNGPAVF